MITKLKVLLSENDKLIHSDFKKLTKKLMRSQIINDGKRVDGRDLDEVRKISASAGILPKRVHGSALFQRGLTQVLSTTTLGLRVMHKKWMILIQVLRKLIYITIIFLLIQ